MTVGIVAWITGRLFESRRANQRRMIVAAVVLILISNPLFLFTSGRSWNHDLPTVLTLLAFVAVAHRGLKNPGSAWWMLAAGVLMGLAVGFRLTFAPPAAAFFFR